MPYVDTYWRETGRYEISSPRSAGELQYEIALLVNDYVNQHGLKYQTLNDVMGALDGASREFYRRVVAPYEDEKIEANGDVYTCTPAQIAERERQINCDHTYRPDSYAGTADGKLKYWCQKGCGHSIIRETHLTPNE